MQATLAGVVRAHVAAKEVGLPLIIGSEIRLDDGPMLRDDGIWQLVRSLPGKQRTAVTLRYLADLSHREIAEVMQTSEDAARRNVFEGLRGLRDPRLRPPFLLEEVLGRVLLRR